MASPSTLSNVLGSPEDCGQDGIEPTNPKITNLLVKDKNVGPFQVTGLRPAVEALERIFTKVKERDPRPLYTSSKSQRHPLHSNSRKYNV